MELLGDRRTTPPAFSFTLLGASALVHEARGNPAAADRILLAMESSVEDRQNRPPLALTWCRAELMTRRGALGDALALLDQTQLAQWSLIALYELLQTKSHIIAEAGWWEQAPALVEHMRAHAREAGLVALPFFADRLEGQAALAGGDNTKAVELLARSRDGLAGLGAQWEAARVDLSLAEAETATGDRDGATMRLRTAFDVFDRLGSLRERDRARELLDGLA
jgi:hypothetical protein